MDSRFPHLVDEKGNFDARKARQMLYEWQRGNATVNHSFGVAHHLGFSSEETYLFMACNLLAQVEHFQQLIMDDLNTRIPTLSVQATQSGPFDTRKGLVP